MVKGRIEKREVIGRIQLLLSTFIWGTSFIFVKTAQVVVPPFFLMALRLSFAVLLLCAIFFKLLKEIDFGYLWRGAIMGTCLFGGMSLQSIGLNDMSPGTNAFLSASYCVFMPFLFWIFYKKRPDVWRFLGSFLCMAGIGFVSIKDNFEIGDGCAITVLSGLMYAGQMLSASIFIKERSPMLLSILQFFFAALLSWGAGFSFSTFPSEIPMDIMWQVLYLAVFCTAMGYTLQAFGQRVVDPTITGMIVTLEAVFAVIISAIFYNENLTLQVIIGFILIFVAILISETKLKFLKNLRRK